MHHKNTLELYIIHIFTNLLLFGMKCILICLSYTGITFPQDRFIRCWQSLQLNKNTVYRVILPLFIANDFVPSLICPGTVVLKEK